MKIRVGCMNGLKTLRRHLRQVQVFMLRAAQSTTQKELEALTPFLNVYWLSMKSGIFCLPVAKKTLLLFLNKYSEWDTNLISIKRSKESCDNQLSIQ